MKRIISKKSTLNQYTHAPYHWSNTKARYLSYFSAWTVWIKSWISSGLAWSWKK